MLQNSQDKKAKDQLQEIQSCKLAIGNESLGSTNEAEDVDLCDLPVGFHRDPLDLPEGGPAGVVHEAPEAIC